MEGSFEMSTIFVENAQSKFEKDKSGRTPLHLSAMCGHLSVCQYFIENGFEIKN